MNDNFVLPNDIKNSEYLSQEINLYQIERQVVMKMIFTINMIHFYKDIHVHIRKHNLFILIKMVDIQNIHNIQKLKI